MTEGRSRAGLEKLERCEELIGRFRQAYHANKDREAEEAFKPLLEIVKPLLIQKARELRFISEAAAQEAYEEMYNRFLDHLCSTTFPSMETKFGSYLKSLGIRILRKVREKHRPSRVSIVIEPIDAPPAEGHLPNDETMSDPLASGLIDSLLTRMDLENALSRLSSLDQTIVRRRLSGDENNAIAAALGVSPATATRLYQHALAHLQTLLEAYE